MTKTADIEFNRRIKAATTPADAIRIGHGGRCNCPREAALCRYAVRWRLLHGMTPGWSGWGPMDLTTEEDS